MVWDACPGHVPDPACSALVSALCARSRPAASGFGPPSPKRTIGSFTGRHGGTEFRVYHGGMAPDTSTLPLPPTPAARPEPATTEPAASAATTARLAHGASETTTLAAADSAAPPAPEAPPDLNLLGDRIAELSARIQAATYELLCDLRVFDRHHGWEGFRSCAHWLNWRIGLDLGAAREKLRVAAALADLNHLSAAMACGRLSYSMVRALTRVATPDNEARLIAVACCATAAQVERLVRAWRQADEEAQPDAEKVRLARRTLSTRVDEDGMVVLRARLTPEVGAVVLRALEAALEQVPAAEDAADGDEASIAQRRADALGLVAESALAGGLDPGNPGDRFQVTVHVEAEGLSCREVAAVPRHVSAEIAPGNEAACEPAAASPHGVADQVSIDESTHDRDRAVPMPGPDAGQPVIEQAGGIHVGKQAVRRFACDAGLVELRHAADGEVLDAGRRTPAPSRPRCAVPCRAEIAASASSPAAVPATATPTTSSIGPTEGRRTSPTWSVCVDFTTAQCTRRGFRWSLTAPGGSSSCARMASRCRRCHRRRAGRVSGRRWRRPWRAWRRPASASVRTPLLPSGMANR